MRNNLLFLIIIILSLIFDGVRASDAGMAGRISFYNEKNNKSSGNDNKPERIKNKISKHSYKYDILMQKGLFKRAKYHLKKAKKGDEKLTNLNYKNRGVTESTDNLDVDVDDNKAPNAYYITRAKSALYSYITENVSDSLHKAKYWIDKWNPNIFTSFENNHLDQLNKDHLFLKSHINAIKDNIEKNIEIRGLKNTISVLNGLLDSAKSDNDKKIKELEKSLSEKDKSISKYKKCISLLNSYSSGDLNLKILKFDSVQNKITLALSYSVYFLGGEYLISKNDSIALNHIYSTLITTYPKIEGNKRIIIIGFADSPELINQRYYFEFGDINDSLNYWQDTINQLNDSFDVSVSKREYISFESEKDKIRSVNPKILKNCNLAYIRAKSIKNAMPNLDIPIENIYIQIHEQESAFFRKAQIIILFHLDISKL